MPFRKAIILFGRGDQEMDGNTVKAENVFRSRNYRLVFFGALVSELGALLYNFAVSFYILQISGNSAFLQGLYLALCGVALLLFTPVGGVLGDRFSKSKIMYLCDYVKGGTIILATFLMLLFPAADAQIAILFVLGVLGNVISGIFNPASGALIPHIVKTEQLQQANAYFTIKSSMESILGVVLAGVLYAALPVHTLFFMVGAAFLISGVSEMLIRCPHTPSPDRLTLKLAVRDMGDGLKYLRTQRAILSLIGLVVFVNFFFAPVSGNFIPYFVRTDLAGAPSYLLDNVLTPELWSSVISVCVGLGSLLGAAVLSARKPAEKCGRTISVRLCVSAAVVVSLALGYWLLVDRGISLNAFLVFFCAGGLVTGVMLSAINIPITTATMRIVDKDKLSKVNSIISVGSQAMIPIASVLAGLVIQTMGSSVLLFACALGFAVTAVLMLMNREVREM